MFLLTEEQADAWATQSAVEAFACNTPPTFALTDNPMSRTIRNKPKAYAPVYWCKPLRKWIFNLADDCFSEWWTERGKYKRKREDRDYRDEIYTALNYNLDE